MELISTWCKQLSYLRSGLTPVRKTIQLQSSSSVLTFVCRANTNIGTKGFSVCSTLWNMVSISVRSVETVTQFCLVFKYFGAVEVSLLLSFVSACYGL